MARRRSRAKPKRRAKYKSAFNIKNAAFGYLGMSVITNTLFNESPVGFIMGTSSSGEFRNFGPSQGLSKISFKELFTFDQYSGGSSHTLGTQIQENITNNLSSGVKGLVGIAIAKKVITATGVSRTFNSAVRSIGMGNLVKM